MRGLAVWKETSGLFIPTSSTPHLLDRMFDAQSRGVVSLFSSLQR